MDVKEFYQRTEEMINYIVHYRESLSERNVNTDVNPGYLRNLLPETAPNEGERFEKIMEDVEKYIMPGLNHWQHPGFHAYFPLISSYPCILAQMLANGIECFGYNYSISISLRELEIIVMDWFRKVIGLPENFLNLSSHMAGGNIILNSLDDCILFCMVTAREGFIKKVSQSRFSLSRPFLVSSLVAYCSKEAHEIMMKDAEMAMVTLNALDTDDNFCLRGDTLVNAIERDKKVGMIPFFVAISLGTVIGTSDSLDEIGQVCERYGLWLNVDAAYAGNALVCPEYKKLLKGIKYVKSFNVNPCKWLMVNLDCSILFVKDIDKISEYIVTDKIMFSHGSSQKDWNYNNYKKPQALKLWLMMRSYGIEGLQKHIRNHVQQAKLFQKCIGEDPRFEILACNFGKVCFRLKRSDEINMDLLRAINTSRKLLLNSYNFKNKFFICFVVCSEYANEDDTNSACILIKDLADRVLEIQSNVE